MEVVMNVDEKMRKLESQLKKKETQAIYAKKKGMNTTYGNLLLEISELKREVRKMSMGR